MCPATGRYNLRCCRLRPESTPSPSDDEKQPLSIQAEPIDLKGSDGKPIYGCRWIAGAPRAAVQIAHGMGEHVGRYGPVAKRLNAAGYVVYGNDHRGHGHTDPDRLGDMGEDGWNRVLEDMRLLNQRMAADHPELKRVLLGHSMGAMLTQQYLCRHGETIDAVVLSGSPGIHGAVQSAITRLLTQIEAWRLGPAGESALLANLLFGQANKDFDNEEASGFEWLSRDPDEVRKYVDDPRCGAVLRTGSLLAMIRGTREAASEEGIARVPKDLPIYVLSGTADPVHNELKGLNRLYGRYAAAGLSVERKLYEEGRHEMFNEVNRDEVLDDLVSWLDGVVRRVG